jgi:cobaltochelatase CobT
MVYRKQIQDIVTYLSSGKTNDMSITFLVDNSGSMRGSKIVDTSSWMTILCEIFESAGIFVEVLGYTTKTWKGGQSREAWLQHGRPPNPGRLNDIRNVIYKEFSSSIKDSRNNFGLMAREGLLKENIDGEALIWAYKRSIEFAKKRKMIVVVNDDEHLSTTPRYQ